MRSIWMTMALPFLAHCGSPQPANKTDTRNETPTQSAEIVNASNQTEARTDNAAKPVADDKLASLSPCLVQGKVRLEVKAIHVVGTEPFWSAKVEGRCVTYSTSDDQKGIRVWTRYSQGPKDGGMWVGQLGGKRFEMRSRSATRCSDGMSDKKYPIAVELTVKGEQRKGCAEFL